MHKSGFEVRAYSDGGGLSTASEVNRNIRKVDSLTTLTRENTNIFFSSKYVNPDTVPLIVNAFRFIHVPDKWKFTTN